MLNETLLSIDEVAAYLKVSRRQVYNYLKHHNLPAVKMGKYWLQVATAKSKFGGLHNPASGKHSKIHHPYTASRVILTSSLP